MVCVTSTMQATDGDQSYARIGFGAKRKITMYDRLRPVGHNIKVNTTEGRRCKPRLVQACQLKSARLPSIIRNYGVIYDIEASDRCAAEFGGDILYPDRCLYAGQNQRRCYLP